MACRATVGELRGMKTLTMENETLRAVVLVGKGGDIVELQHKPLGVDVMWHSPTGLRSRDEVSSLISNAETGFGDLYSGGWQDVLPVMGHGPSVHRGALFGLHGETPVLPWEGPSIEEESGQVTATIGVRGVRYPYRLSKKLTIRDGEPKLHLREELTNTSAQDLEFFWLQHPAYGEPFLSPGCRIDLPQSSEIRPLTEINPNGRLAEGNTKWPHAKARNGENVDMSVIPPRETKAEETSFVKVQEPWYSIRNTSMDLGVALRWDLAVHPWLWFWQNYNLPDYPWYGDAWNVALEPSSSFPARTEEHLREGSYLLVRGRQTIVSELTFSFCKGSRPVIGVDRSGSVDQ